MPNNNTEFKPRLTQPSANNKWYTSYKNGGYNTCLVINSSTGSVMPNCVGYAQGRLLELHNVKKVDWKLPACNAEDWYDKAKSNGLKVGTEVRLGSVIVWSRGKTHCSTDGCGHVAVVEKIASDGTITISESGYGSYNFKTEEVKPPYNRSDYKLLGFVYPYDDYGTGELGTVSSETQKNDTPVTTKISDETFATQQYYTVVKGDTLWGIATRYLGSGNRYKEIMELNNLRSTVINIGQELKIPV